MRTLITALVVLLSAAVNAQQAGIDEQARAAVQEALEAQATPPSAPPELPDQAAEAARSATGQNAFGKRGAAERAAKSQAQKHALDSTEKVRLDAQLPPGQVNATAAGKAQSEAQAAVGQAKSAAAKSAGPNRPRPPKR